MEKSSQSPSQLQAWVSGSLLCLPAHLASGAHLALVTQRAASHSGPREWCPRPSHLVTRKSRLPAQQPPGKSEALEAQAQFSARPQTSGAAPEGGGLGRAYTVLVLCPCSVSGQHLPQAVALVSPGGPRAPVTLPKPHLPHLPPAAQIPSNQ